VLKDDEEVLSRLRSYGVDNRMSQALINRK
jgi:hypothetical protein